MCAVVLLLCVLLCVLLYAIIIASPLTLRTCTSHFTLTHVLVLVLVQDPLHGTLVWRSRPASIEVELNIPVTWDEASYHDTIRIEDEEGSVRDMELYIPITLEIDPETGQFSTASSGHHSRSLGLMTSADIARNVAQQHVEDY